jgi:hypothetical protein
VITKPITLTLVEKKLRYTRYRKKKTNGKPIHPPRLPERKEPFRPQKAPTTSKQKKKVLYFLRVDAQPRPAQQNTPKSIDKLPNCMGWV